MRIYFLISIVLLIASCGSGTNGSNSRSVGNANATPKPAALPVYSYDVVKAYPHDSKAFTQGLVFRDGFLYESTGEIGKSSLRKVDITTGKVLQKFDLASEIFAEGLTIMNDKLYQISWQNNIAWEYDIADFKMLREMSYSGEGWGLTTDGTNLIMSDGTHVIRIVNPKDFSTTRTIVVKDENGRPLMKLNELEYVKGEIWSNIWHSEELGKPNHIARIDPANGRVNGWIDLAGISPDDQDGENESENTLNGIAYDADNDRIFVTGKKWKRLYEIKLKPKQ
jgi:glutamine cyclotransferase